MMRLNATGLLIMGLVAAGLFLIAAVIGFAIG